MSGSEYVRGEDPDTSHRAVERLYPNLPKRRKQCVLMIRLVGHPCTRSEIRAKALEQYDDVDLCESIRRRATDLLKLGILVVVDGRGDRELLWFKPEEGKVIPLHGPRQDPTRPASRVRRTARRQPQGDVLVEDVPVHDERRIVHRRVSRPGRQRPTRGGAGPHQG